MALGRIGAELGGIRGRKKTAKIPPFFLNGGKP